MTLRVHNDVETCAALLIVTDWRQQEEGLQSDACNYLRTSRPPTWLSSTDLRLHRRVGHNTGEIGRLHRARPGRNRQILLQQHLLVFSPSAGANAASVMSRQPPTHVEKFLAAEVLELRFLSKYRCSAPTGMRLGPWPWR